MLSSHLLFMRLWNFCLHYLWNQVYTRSPLFSVIVTKQLAFPNSWWQQQSESWHQISHLGCLWPRITSDTQAQSSVRVIPAVQRFLVCQDSNKKTWTIPYSHIMSNLAFPLECYNYNFYWRCSVTRHRLHTRKNYFLWKWWGTRSLLNIYLMRLRGEVCHPFRCMPQLRLFYCRYLLHG